MSIRVRLFLLFLMTVLLLGVLGSYAMMTFRSGLIGIQQLQADARMATDTANRLELRLQLERTAWKNILLRGKEPTDYYRYLSEYYAQERLVRDDIDGLERYVANDSDIMPLLAELRHGHFELGRALRKGMRVFNASEENPHLFADQAAAELESMLSSLVGGISALVKEKQQTQLALRRDELIIKERLLIFSLVVAGSGAILVFLWALDRNIGRPAEQAAFLSNYDPLTELPNRNLFQDRLQHAISQAQRNADRVALLFFDLDHFKSVNDALGHQAGDALLKQVGDRLRATLRDSDTPARLGGDEFAVIIEHYRGERHIARVAENILVALNSPFEIGSQRAHVSASIGITRYPDDGQSPQQLVKNADSAMYLAKQKGRARYRFFTEELNRAAEQRLELENLLREATAAEGFELHYQPQFSLKDGCLVAVEALLRFQCNGGFVSPDRFVPVLEDTGLINKVGLWALETACATAQRWRLLLGRDIRVAVNLSACQLQDDRFCDAVANTLRLMKLPSHCLEVEITERNLLETQAGGDVLRRLEQLGVRLAIDDFGTGYSSLSYLKSFAIDELKIDRSFIRDITCDDDDDAVTSAIIALAHKLGIEVVAEGVETALQHEFLIQQGCDIVQGFLFGRPLPLAALEAWMIEGATVAVPNPAVGRLMPS